MFQVWFEFYYYYDTKVSWLGIEINKDNQEFWI